MSKGKIFMAFSKGQISSEEGERKNYIGVGSVFVKAVNPTKEELENIYRRHFDNDPVYSGEIDVNGVKKPFVRVEFIVKTDPDKNDGIDTIQRVSFMLRNEPRYNRDMSKSQIIDKYGRTAWATLEQIKNHEIPQYSNGPAQIDPDYRQAFVGEENLTNFVKCYLNIPNVTKYVNKEWVMIDKPAEAEARLEKIPNYFKMDFSELKELISFQPNNKLKVAFGVKTTEDNKQYQAFYTEMPLKNGTSDYSRLEDDIKRRQANGSHPNTIFEVCPLKEYVNTPSDIPSSNAPIPPSAWVRPN